MYKLLLAILFAVPPTIYAQAIPFYQSAIASFTANGIYVFNDAQSGHNRSLIGWSVVPEVNFLERLGLQADVTKLSVRSIFPGESRLLLAAGPRFNFVRRSRISPFLFAEGGEMKLTSQYSSTKDWNPVFKGGFGFEYRVTRAISISLVPGEYLGQYQDDHLWNHSFSVHAGITFNRYRWPLTQTR